jgi:uncharacterized BrkB/YihY/UPF0761 family membrane protein
MNLRRFNWPIWTGLLISLIAFFSYFSVFVWFPVTRNFPWVNLLLFAVAAALLLVGLRRAFARDKPHPMRSKIAAIVVAVLSLAIFGFFIATIFIIARNLPASQRAPQVGQKAPDFSLSDTNGNSVSLSKLLASPLNGKAPKGVLLIFYRGYW